MSLTAQKNKKNVTKPTNKVGEQQYAVQCLHCETVRQFKFAEFYDLSLYYAPLPLLKYGHPTLFEVLYLHYSTSPICYIEVNVNNDNLTCTAHFGCFLTWEGSIN